MKQQEQTLEIKYRRLDTIKPLPGNTRIHDLQGIKSSISEFGFIDPILISAQTGHDLDGNGRLEALKLLYGENAAPPGNILVKMEAPDGGGKKVPVWYVPTLDAVFDAETEPIVALRLNRAHGKGAYNEAKVFAVLEQAQAFGRLEQTGYDQTLFEMLAIRHAPEPEFEAPVPMGGNGSVIAPAADGAPSAAPLPGARPTTQPEDTPTHHATPTLGPSHVRMVQLFLNADTQPVFYQRTQALTASGRYLNDDDRPVNNLTDLVFCVIRDAYYELRNADAAPEETDD